MKNVRFLGILALGSLVSSTASATVPLSFSHHGVLKEDGNLVNGLRNITATIYDDQGGVVGRINQDVNVVSGLYTMVIDNIDVAKVVTTNRLTLSINVEGDDLQPALNITAVPYALAAEHSVTADGVVCRGCITPDHLSFNALQDSALPNCAVNQVLRQAAGSVWECTDAVAINDQTGGAAVTNIKGDIGINIDGASLSIGRFTYFENGKSDLPDGAVFCPCDINKSENDCMDTFALSEDIGPICYDRWGGTSIEYKRSAYIAPLSGVVAIENGNIGIGTGKPAAPIHLRSDSGAEKYEIIIADTQPEILLEDLDGTNYKVALNDGTLSIAKMTDDGQDTPLMTLDDNGLTITGNINATSFAGDLTVRAEDVSFNYAASKSKGGAASSIEDDIVTSAKIKDGSIVADDLAADAVVTAKIKDASVTKAKLDSGVQSSLGLADNAIQKTAGSVNSTYILDGTIVNADISASAAIAKSKLESGVQSSLGLADNAIQKTTGSVTSAYIADGTIVNADISATAAIAKDKLASSVQTSLGRADKAVLTSDTGTVTSTIIKDGTIIADDLASNAVTTIKIANANVTKAKLETSVQNSLGLADNAIQKTTGSVTSAYIADGTIVNADISASAAIAKSKLDSSVQTSLGLADTSIQDKSGSVTSTHILDGTIVNADISASAAIAKDKLASSVQTSLGRADKAVLTSDTGTVTSTIIKDGTIIADDLASNAVTTIKIANANVTKAKLETSVQNSLGLADNAIQKTTGSVTSTYIADGTIATADLANSSVTSDKIADGTIVNADISATAAIAKSKLESSVQTSLGLADNALQKSTGSVTTGHILNGTIINDDISTSAAIAKSKLESSVQTSLGLADNAIQKATGSVTSTYIADGTITTADLANASITQDKLDNLYPAKAYASFKTSIFTNLSVVGETAENTYGVSISSKANIATIEHNGMGVINVTFAQPMANTDYFVMLNFDLEGEYESIIRPTLPPSIQNSHIGPVGYTITNKTINGFTVSTNEVSAQANTTTGEVTFSRSNKQIEANNHSAHYLVGSYSVQHYLVVY